MKENVFFFLKCEKIVKEILYTHTHAIIYKSDLKSPRFFVVFFNNNNLLFIYFFTCFYCIHTRIQNLNNLLEHYLEPLKRETFLSNAEIAALFGNIQEIFTFQRQFLQNLEEALELEPDFHKFDHSSQFKVSRKNIFLLF